MAKTTYKVLQGIDYPPKKRAEAGDIVDDLPASAISWLLEAGAIERVATPKKSVSDSPKTKSDSAPSFSLVGETTELEEDEE